MAKALFLCRVVLGPTGAAYPAILNVMNGPAGPFPCSWSIPTFADTRRVAVGLCEVTPGQLTLIQADPLCRAVNLAGAWRGQQWNQIPVGMRNALRTFAQEEGLDVSGVVATTLISTILRGLIAQLRPARQLEHIDDEMRLNFGVNP